MDCLKINCTSWAKLSLLSICIVLYSSAESVADSVSGHSMTEFQSMPIGVLGDTTTPQVQINTTNDHQLFFKVYNDYSDLDGDGVPETTYKHSIDYYGYFDGYKCYTYDIGDERFKPVSLADANKYCNSAGSSGDEWSGNFLNWASMTRIDTIRKILFGGHRRVDTFSGTVLERSFLPPDIHSFAKYYDGTDTAQLTPFTANNSAPTGSSVSDITIGTGNKSLSTQTGDWIKIGDYLTIQEDISGFNYSMKGWVTAFDDSTGALTVSVETIDGSGSYSSWNISNHTRTGITLCNVTYSSSTTVSEKITDPPLIRVAAGNYSFWAAGEKNQCLWDGEVPAAHGLNYNNPEYSGMYAAQDNPKKPDVGLGINDYVVRVEACLDTDNDGALDFDSGHETCKLYPYGNLKPIGLLQEFGDDDQLLFGMIAGTYANSTSGGDMIMPLFNDDGNGSNMCREINLNRDCDDDGDIDDLVIAGSRAAGDGTFKRVFNWVGGPADKQNADGVINSWSLYRIRGYEYGVWDYASNQADACPLSINFFGDSSDSQCTNWGNPFAEIYLTALRQWVGENAPNAYQALDKLSGSVFDGLNYTPGVWLDPLDEDNYCAPLSVINFSTSVISVDTAFGSETDELDTTALGIEKDLGSPYSSRELTQQIGEEEGIYETGKTWFIGETTVDNSKTCTPKEITNLGDVRGICPEGPGQRGGFRIAGMAWYAHTNDIRPDSLLSGHALKGTQTVDNYSVRLSDGSPLIEIPVPGTSDKKVTIIPSCITNNKDNYGCTLVDFKIVVPHTEITDANGDVVSGHGKFLAIWEDSLQGNDYDMDVGGIIEYTITNSEIKVTTAVTLEALSYAVGHGYVISGTGDTDGLHLHSGTNSFDYTDTNGGCFDNLVPCIVDTGCTNCFGVMDGGTSSTVAYSIGDSSAGILEDPLWYAAKWGGFTDLNDNKMPDLVEEWDTENNKTGAEGADGIPDNYFYASQPQELEDALRRTFNAILERTSSGTAAAVVSSNVRGEGALYQAFYEPLKKDGDKEARWIGTIQALWLDSAGYTREDCTPKDSDYITVDGNILCSTDTTCGDPNGKLDDYCVDQVVETYYDELEKRVRVRVLGSNEPDTFEGSGDISLKEINELSYLWNGREKLYLDGVDLTENRLYSSSLASTGRYIMTWIDKDYDGEVDSDEYIDFHSDMFTASAVPYGFFDVATETEAGDVINYIRGIEVAGTRNRTIKYSTGDTANVMRLGDIINSTPTIVGSPQEAFNLLYKDLSYTDFRHQYQDRRNMVYVGSNDGLLHAFNGGFYKDTNGVIEYSTIGTNCADNSLAVAHELGSEMWAYAPMNLLSHLQWLKAPSYAGSHVYYIDGKPRVFDANIFPDDADHPNGWGTVLVVGMNLGGGKMEVDVDSDGSAADVTMRSAYIVLDITNPENAPVLLGEIPIPDESFSTVYPAVMAFRDVDATNCNTGLTACNRWYLVFGNGPNDISSYATDQNGKVYLFDLEQLTTSVTPLPISADHPLVDPSGLCSVDALTATMNILTCDTGIAARFMGTPMVVDWDLDFFADTVYFGLVGNSDADTGRLIRFALDNDVEPTQWSVPETLFLADQPILVQPIPGLDNLYNKWIFFGTGRYFTIDDKTSIATQSLYGIKDDGSGEVFDTDLVDVSNVEVYSDRTLTDNGAAMTGIETFDDLVDYVDDTDPSNPTNNKGWIHNLPPIVGTAGSVPATRNISRSTLLGGILFSSVFQPSVDPCEGEGRSRLYGLFYKTGTAYPGPTVFGTITETDTSGNTKDRSLKFYELGTGFATTPSLHSGADSGEEGVSVFTQLSTGDVVRKAAETVHKVRTGRVTWKNECF